jgi:S-adenosylmethionine:tRNA ribosyltransferase-isomerase
MEQTVPPVPERAHPIDETPASARAFLASFEVPAELEADGPIEASGVDRDAVRLQIASHQRGIWNTSFTLLASVLDPGDVLVVNDSATLPAALPGMVRGQDVFLHVSVPAPTMTAEYRAVEVRSPRGISSERFYDVHAGDVVSLPAGGSATIIEPFAPRQDRLWLARLSLPTALVGYLQAHGRPIRYSYVGQPWPLESYQTIFASEPGSSEMPSAGRAFSTNTLESLARRGVTIESITLHTGVGSLESHEPPYPEPYSVPRRTAIQVNRARARSNRVIAVGTTVVRALQTVCDDSGAVASGSGFTDLVIHPEDRVAAVDGILTGWHEPKATHLHMLEAIAGPQLLAGSYAAALASGYKWHEFGDMQLLLADNRTVT